MPGTEAEPTGAQDTSWNLTRVDRMLGQYREHSEDQAEAMAVLRDNLEESINQLQTQRMSRSNDGPSVSASTLHTSDLEACSGSDGQRCYSTGPPPRDCAGTPGRRRRSQSAGVRFKNTSPSGEEVHTLHQSLRDLSFDQQKLSVDLDREILRRNRAEIDTRRAIESLTEHLTSSQRQTQCLLGWSNVCMSWRREMQSEQRSTDREEKLEQELERARRRLEQSEDSRESLVQQVQEFHDELLRTRKEKELQRIRLETSFTQPHGSYTDREEGRSGPRAPERREDGRRKMEGKTDCDANAHLHAVENEERSFTPATSKQPLSENVRQHKDESL
ncbi:unnamed protein product [Lampetra planeri]